MRWLSVVVCAVIVVPAIAAAQAVSPLGWNQDGNVVVRVDDPDGKLRANFGWGLKRSIGASYYAACVPQGAGSIWNSGCRICVDDASKAADPTRCGLRAKQTRPLTPGRHKAFPVRSTRECANGACATHIDVGRFSRLRHDDVNILKRPLVETYFGPGGPPTAALVRVSEVASTETPASVDIFAVDLTIGPAAEPLISKMVEMAWELCVCKDNNPCRNKVIDKYLLWALSRARADSEPAYSPEQLERLEKARRCER